MAAINITEDVQALHKFNEIKELIKESATYYFQGDSSPTHEDDAGELREDYDYTSYTFTGGELKTLDTFLSMENTPENVAETKSCLKAMKKELDSDTNEWSESVEAMYLVVSEYGATHTK
jgi:hypothetical protein